MIIMEVNNENGVSQSKSHECFHACVSTNRPSDDDEFKFTCLAHKQ